MGSGRPNQEADAEVRMAPEFLTITLWCVSRGYGWLGMTPRVRWRWFGWEWDDVGHSFLWAHIVFLHGVSDGG